VVQRTGAGQEFDVSTFSGDLRNELGHSGKVLHVEDEGKSLTFTVGDGTAEVEIETFSGDVRVNRK